MPTEWDFLITLNEQLRPLKDPVEIQEVAVRLIGEHLRASRVNYGLVDGDVFVVSRSYADGVPPCAGRGSVALFGKAIADACRRGETVNVDDVNTDPRFTDAEREQLLAGETAAFVSAPLIKSGRWLATFGVHSATPRTWTRDQIALVAVTAERTWGAGERARAEEALEALGRSESRQAFLHRLYDTIRPLADPARILQETCRLLGTHLCVNRVAYGEIEGDDCIIVHDYVDGVPSMAGRVQWGNLVGSRTADILQGKTLSINDTSTESHTAEERAVLEAAGIKAYIGSQLIKEGRFVGAFGIHSRSPRVWTLDEIALVQDVADRIWATLEHRKAEAELRANEQRLAFILRLNDALRPLRDPVEIQNLTVRLVGEHLCVNGVAYFVIDGDDFIVTTSYDDGVTPIRGRWPLATFGALLEAYKRGEPVTVSDIRTDPRFTDAERGKLLTQRIVALLRVMLRKEGRWVATFGVNSSTPRHWTRDEIALIEETAERMWSATERARAETALRESEERLRLVLDASAAGSWTRDPDADHVDWDLGFRRLYGFAPDEPASLDKWLGRVHEDDRQAVLALFDEAAHPTKDAWDIPFRIVRPDGTVSWIQSMGRVERDGAGTITRLAGLELDVTARRHAEETLQARRDEEHTRELRLLLETAAQGIASVNARGLIVTANRALETMFGWQPGELIGQPVEQLIPLSVRNSHQQHRSSYFVAPRPRLMGGGLDLVGRRQDGSTFPIEVSLNHVPTSDGGRAIAFVTDITERRRAALALQERTVELERRSAQLSRLASELTLAEQHTREQLAKTLHDGLQQLLVSTAMNVDRLMQQGAHAGIGTEDPLPEVKGQLAEAIDAARSLSYELFPPVLERSGLPAALAWLAGWTRKKYGLEVELHADPLANSDRKDIRTLLLESVRELLFNAVKHARVDRVTVDLTREPNDMLHITVSDQGVGFDPWLIERAQTDQIGWGLFSIRERLTLLGGRFEIESAPGRGSRFVLTVPRAMAPESPAAPPPSSPATAGAPLSGAVTSASPRALKILLVDDHAAVRKSFRQLLQARTELQIVGEAANGLEAIAQVRALLPDVVVMDVSMPEMDGIEATRRIRAEFRSIQVLGLSMYPRTEHLHGIEQAGAQRFFVKGVDTQRLVDYLLSMHSATGAAVFGG